MSLIFNEVEYTYNPGTSFEKKAVTDISFKIDDGDFVAIVGQTGSGKSTLIQMMNGLIKPSKGEIYYNGEDIWDKDYSRKKLRGKVGMVFQYPEHQLFETSVIKDVCFGPKNIGMKELDAQISAFEALKEVGVGDEFIDYSPLELSGGMKRRVAIAGVLAMKPEVIILDEPTAGLDPEGRNHILGLLKRLNEEKGLTIVLVSHSMEDVAKYAHKVIVMNKGNMVAYDDTMKVFADKEIIDEAGLALPQMCMLYFGLAGKGILLPDIPRDETDAYKMISDLYENMN